MNKIMKRMKNRKGFTLIELIVVIAIIAILAVVLIPRFTGFTESAREKSALSDARNVLLALEAIDASGEWTTDNDFVTAVNTYIGKDLLVSSKSDASDGNAWFSEGPAQGTKGIDFTFMKNDNGTDYTIYCTNSVLSTEKPSGGTEAPAGGS